MVSTTNIEEITKELKKSPEKLEQLTIIGSLQGEIEVLINQIEYDTQNTHTGSTPGGV